MAPIGEKIQNAALYIVSTPIGNLEDITLRAVETLSQVDLIAAEDTRKTKTLLERYNIQKPLVSYFSYNEEKRTPELIAKLKDGNSIAVVSDAGTPGISDPAFHIIHSALEERIPVVSIPGPTAFLTALIVSGLLSERFIFEGYLPAKKGRMTKLDQLRSIKYTLILYEAPHRLLRTLHDLKKIFGDRRITVVRELTKKFEEIFRGTFSSAISNSSIHPVRGEFVLVIEGAK